MTTPPERTLDEYRGYSPANHPKFESWRRLLADATDRLGDSSDARRIVEEASGRGGADLTLHLDDRATAITHHRWATMVERRLRGEPLQYVLGRWGFRTLDLMVDRRVLIPRPETEIVVEVALAEADRIGATTAADLGTGSGAIALSLAAERPKLHVWATDQSADSLAVARANLAGIGRAGTRVRIVRGDWFDALPADLRGALDLVVSNPPYVGAVEPLPVEVRDWEPVEALVPGPTGLEAIERIVAAAPFWLSDTGVLVLEIGETQAKAATELAHRAGFIEVTVRRDLAERDRVLVATRS